MRKTAMLSLIAATVGIMGATCGMAGAATVFSEDFESGTLDGTGWSPGFGCFHDEAYWQLIDGHDPEIGGGNDTWFLSFAKPDYHESKGTQDQAILTPPISFGTNKVKPTLRFWQKTAQQGTGDYLEVGVRTSVGGYRTLAVYHEQLWGWTERTLSLPGPADDYRIYFYAYIYHYRYGGFAIDDVVVTGEPPGPFLPDALIHNGTTWVGDDTYNIDGEWQTHSKTVAAGVPAAYDVQIANDGQLSDTLRITGSAGNKGWSVVYREHWTKTDITAAVTGAGWISPYLRPGKACRLRVTVTPLAGSMGDRPLVVRVTGRSTGDPTTRDAVKAVTTCEPRYQPDGHIHNGTAYIGDDVFNATGVGQTYGLTAAVGTTATYFLRFCNDGNVSQRLRIRGTPSTDQWTVRYLEYWTGTDITKAVRTAGWPSPDLGPGKACCLKVLVTPRASAAGGPPFAALVGAASTVDATKTDAVKAVTTCAARYQPDGHIYNGTAYIGDEIFNTTGVGQTFGLTAAVGATATYYPRFYNDGNVIQRLRITGTAGTSQWTVRYLEYWTNADITAAVTGAGWSSPELSPGKACCLKVLVTPRASAARGASFAALVCGTSTVASTKRDTVKTVTIRK